MVVCGLIVVQGSLAIILDCTCKILIFTCTEQEKKNMIFSTYRYLIIDSYLITLHCVLFLPSVGPSWVGSLYDICSSSQLESLLLFSSNKTSSSTWLGMLEINQFLKTHRRCSARRSESTHTHLQYPAHSWLEGSPPPSSKAVTEVFVAFNLGMGPPNICGLETGHPRIWVIPLGCPSLWWEPPSTVKGLCHMYFTVFPCGTCSINVPVAAENSIPPACDSSENSNRQRLWHEQSASHV